MTKNDLPNKIAVFPLSNAIFFPRTILPLNIFEDRYIQLVSDCMKEEKLFGMIQPKVKSDKKPEVYTVGCLGKIIDFNETTDRRFIISLSGIVRFKIKKELNNNKLYREFNVDYSDFIDDLEIKKNKLKNFTESQLFKKIKLFFHKLNYSIEFNELLKLNFDQLINTVCMISPFSVQEKQKLIEIVNTEEKIKILEDIIDFNLLSNQENTTVQ
tara:strand:+ start:126 stop:764 length:639 start_codon:yes stop_codon:yes gene_type:complete